MNIDLVVPSYNFRPNFVEKIRKIKIPSNVKIKYYIVIDNPKLEIPDIENIIFIKNEKNLGAHLSRNKGIDAGTGEWILFLDDDVEPDSKLIIEYCKKISENNAPGYIGRTNFPEPCNRFTQAVLDSDILTFFPLAETRDSMWWGVTANMIINRKAIGNIRFDNKFPKAGGGEDIDLCLKICKKENREFLTVPKANVNHGWWNDGKFSLKRFGRWAYGDSRLPSIHPKWKYYNFPNVAESIFLAILGLVIGYFSGFLEIWWVIMIPVSILFAEVFSEFIKLGFTKRWSILNSIIVVCIRGANDCGRLLGNLSRGRVHGILERFDYFCTGEAITHERKVAFFKMVMHLISIIMIITINP